MKIWSTKLFNFLVFHLEAKKSSDKVLQKIFPEFLSILKAFFPERCFDLGTFSLEYALEIA